MRIVSEKRIVWQRNGVQASRRRFVLMLSAFFAFAGCATLTRAQGAAEHGDAAKGADTIAKFGCGACHTIPGIGGADGVVGPPLTSMGRRVFIAGILQNTPENLVTWLLDPQAVVPGNAMPNVGLTDDEARDIAAYLRTLR